VLVQLGNVNSISEHSFNALNGVSEEVDEYLNDVNSGRYSIYTGARREREAWAWNVNVRRDFSRLHYSIYLVSVKTIIVLSFSLAKTCHYKVSQFLTLMCGFGYKHVHKYKRKYRWW